MGIRLEIESREITQGLDETLNSRSKCVCGQESWKGFQCEKLCAVNHHLKRSVWGRMENRFEGTKLRQKPTRWLLEKLDREMTVSSLEAERRGKLC